MADECVCHVTSVHAPFDSRVFYHECMSLAKRYRTVLVCRDNGGQRHVEGVEIDPLPRASGRTGRFLGSSDIVAQAEHLGAALYHFHDPELLPAMASFAERSGTPVVYDAHEHYPDAMDQKAWIPAFARPFAARYADRLERRYVPRMTAVVTADSALTDRYREMHDRVVQLDNYPPLSLFEEAASGTGVESLAAQPPTLVYVGGISVHRGFREMLEVLGSVRSEVPDARLIMYGRPTEDVERVLRRALSAFPAEAVDIRGPVHYGHLPELLGEAHLGLSLLQPHPKYQKNVSMKVFDYMAAGLPYVASDFPPLRAATGGRGGMLVAPGDPQEAAAACVALLTHEQLREAAGRDGRSLVRERLNWESLEQRLFGLYEGLLKK